MHERGGPLMSSELYKSYTAALEVLRVGTISFAVTH